MQLLERKIDKYLLEWKSNAKRKPLIVKGARMVKFYYTLSYHFERVFLPELTDDQLALMTYEERKSEGDKRDLLDEQHELYHEIEEIEAQLEFSHKHGK